MFPGYVCKSFAAITHGDQDFSGQYLATVNWTKLRYRAPTTSVRARNQVVQIGGWPSRHRNPKIGHLTFPALRFGAIPPVQKDAAVLDTAAVWYLVLVGHHEPSLPLQRFGRLLRLGRPAAVTVSCG